ncbi:MAG: hypothetical protein CME88_11720 [Hirschia sp.]|nr:hypothetical protein [Hirschia sp.]MBB37283.1 hypothetical protein [Hirschia sp.]MBF19037.1 hypothetical protein [Hirschia sp.]|tara:strand:+ start:130 stop:1560 length:1431 start_codon:yes stop_codon:yes gene_type:complete
MANINRRGFLSSGAALGMLGGSGVLGLMANQRAFASDVSGYKALVCIFFKGGMDHADVVLPYDDASLKQLRDKRKNLHSIYDSTNTPRTRSNLRQLNAINANSFGGRQFALPPEMPEAQALFNAGDLSIVGGVGPLVEPTTRTAMMNKTAILPDRLFSHNDQQSTWMSLRTEGAREGWGGKFASRAYASSPNDSSQFMAITTSSTDVFLASETVPQFRMDKDGVPDLAAIAQQSRLGRSQAHDSARAKFLAHLKGQNLQSNNLYLRDMIAAGGGTLDNSDQMRTALATAKTITTPFPSNDLADQLAVVAQTIAIQEALNVRRQVFYVTFGGFDMHSGQAAVMPGRLSAISSALAAFREALAEIGMWENVTTFTASDFGRTVIDNGDGTDHGWGAHHLIMGGAVKGGHIYGEMADYDTEGERYTKSRGRLIPAVSVEQYAGTLGSWFGMDTGELRSALPNLGNFDNQNLGFFKTQNS